MRAGELRTPLVLERPTTTLSASGESTPAYETVVQLFGDITPGTGAESYQAGQVNPEVTHSIRIRWHPDVTARMRFNWVERKRKFNIISVTDPETRDRELVCLCREEALRNTGGSGAGDIE